ncbi:hypothetical protein AAVH_04116 [Aphelenchoides avenae]|nr:hypothetical protein AAVH_04116 [Aphelenchus avenae]
MNPKTPPFILQTLLPRGGRLLQFHFLRLHLTMLSPLDYTTPLAVVVVLSIAPFLIANTLVGCTGKRKRRRPRIVATKKPKKSESHDGANSSKTKKPPESTASKDASLKTATSSTSLRTATSSKSSRSGQEQKRSKSRQENVIGARTVSLPTTVPTSFKSKKVRADSPRPKAKRSKSSCKGECVTEKHLRSNGRVWRNVSVTQWKRV